MINGALGKKTGFFAQYAFMDCVKPVARYPAIARACEKADCSAVLEYMSAADFSGIM